MLEAVLEHGILFYVIGVMCILGVIGKIITQTTLRKLVREAGKMGKSLHPLMKLVRAKFEHACMISDKVQNVRAFVDKYMYEYKVLGIKLHSWRQLEKIAAWGSIVFGGAGCALAYLEGVQYEKMGQYAGAGLAGAMLLFAIRMVTDEMYQIEAAKNYMVDFLENTYARRYERINRKTEITEEEGIQEEAAKQKKETEEPAEVFRNPEIVQSTEETETIQKKEESMESDLMLLMKEEQKKQEEEERAAERKKNEQMIRDILAEFLT